MPAKTNGDRLDRLEQIVQVLAEDQVSLQKLIADLATETRRGFDQVADKFRQTDERFRETNEQLRQTNEQLRRTSEEIRQTNELVRQSNVQTNERIEKLVSAIGELIRIQYPPR